MSVAQPPSAEEREMLINLFKCHFNSREVEAQTRFSYQVIRNLFRGFEAAGIEKYDRMNLLPKEATDDAEYDTKQAAAC